MVYHKGHPTSNAILFYQGTKREVVQQCIANLILQLHDHYEHVEVIAEGIFEDNLIALYPYDASNVTGVKSGCLGRDTLLLSI